MLSYPPFPLEHRDPVPAQRVRTLEALRSSVRENSGRLLVANLKKLFQSLAQCLADPDHHIPLQALGLLADIAPDCIHDVGNFIPLILVCRAVWFLFSVACVCVL